MLEKYSRGFIFVFTMKMISGHGLVLTHAHVKARSVGRIINIHGVKCSRSEDYPRKMRKFIPLEISYHGVNVSVGGRKVPTTRCVRATTSECTECVVRMCL